MVALGCLGGAVQHFIPKNESPSPAPSISSPTLGTSDSLAGEVPSPVTLLNMRDLPPLTPLMKLWCLLCRAFVKLDTSYFPWKGHRRPFVCGDGEEMLESSDHNTITVDELIRILDGNSESVLTFTRTLYRLTNTGKRARDAPGGFPGKCFRIRELPTQKPKCRSKFDTFRGQPFLRPICLASSSESVSKISAWLLNVELSNGVIITKSP